MLLIFYYYFLLHTIWRQFYGFFSMTEDLINGARKYTRLLKNVAIFMVIQAPIQLPILVLFSIYSLAIFRIISCQMQDL